MCVLTKSPLQTGGRDTAGLGGKGGYMRLFKGHNIKQISDKDKNSVPDHIKDQARQMAREELKRRLEELDMSAGEAKEYGGLLAEVEAHVNVLFELLESKWFLIFVGSLICFVSGWVGWVVLFD